MDYPLPVVSGLASLAVLAAWAYFRRYRATRPPIGVLNRRDVVVMLVAIVTLPYLYLVLPALAAATLLGLGVTAMLGMTLEPVLPNRAARRCITATLVVGDILTALRFGQASHPFIALNDVVLLLVVIGASNLWAQSGMKARDARFLAVGLTIYDFVATSALQVMQEIYRHLSTIPFVPWLGWGDSTTGLAIGLGDLLLAAVFPLVMRKAYGRRAGIVALVTVVAAVVAVLMLVQTGVVSTAVPAMVGLGPLIVIEVTWWQRRHQIERTTVQYLLDEPMLGPVG